jgi:hypothetical protein
MLYRRLAPRENEDRAGYDSDNPGNGWHHAAFLRCHLQRPYLYFIMTLGVRYAAHRDDDDARNYENYPNPGEWPQ